jgi:hypothetical protein
MTVKEVFDLRKQGKIEEAYEAIRPMYAVHKGKYTTLCMFWVGSDIMKKRLQENQTAEATKIFEALLHVAPNIDDKDNKVHEAVLHNALRLKEAVPSFSLLDFMKLYGIDHLTDADWAEFTERVVQSGFKYDLMSRKQLDDLVKTAKYEGYYDKARDLFDALTLRLRHDVAADLNKHRTTIQQIMELDIVTAYYYQRGAIEAGLPYDKQLGEAYRLLNTAEEYRRILTQ